MSEAITLPVEPSDSFGQSIRILTAVIAVLLSIFTITAHRTHSKAIELQKEVNDHWAHYQAKRIRDNQLEMNSDLVAVMAGKNAKTQKLLAGYALRHEQYAKELSELKIGAVHAGSKSVSTQKKALYFDLSVVVLEISLVMCSLYFIANKRIFPLLGLIAGVLAMLAGIFGYMM